MTSLMYSRMSVGERATDILTVTAIFLVGLVSVRPAPKSSTLGVEQWMNLTNELFYGDRDFIFSYGPLFWLFDGVAQPYNLASYILSVVAISATGAIFWGIATILAWRTGSLWMLGAMFICLAVGLFFPQQQATWPLLVIAYLEYRKEKPIESNLFLLAIFGLLAAIFMYVRFYYGLIAVATFGSYFLYRSIKYRKIYELPVLSISFAIGYLALGMLIFKEGGSITSYVMRNLQLGYGNAVDMTLDVSENVIVAALSAILVAGIFVQTALLRPAMALSTLAIVLISIKLGFGRSDHFTSHFVLMVLATWLVLTYERSSFGRTIASILGLLLVILGNTPIFPGAPTLGGWRLPIDFVEPYDRRMSRTYAEFVLPEEVLKEIGSETIDIYPYRNEYAFANRLNYRHRPSFQNYMTLTPALDEENSRFLSGRNRPEFVLWTGEVGCVNDCNPFFDVDGKLSLNEDPLTVDAILSNYVPIVTTETAAGAPVTLFKASVTGGIRDQRQLEHFDMAFGEWYKIPQRQDGHVVRLELSLTFTFIGRLRNLLWRGEPLYASYLLESGVTMKVRTNILNSASGLWASPFLKDLTFAGEEVVAIRLEPPSSNYMVANFVASWRTYKAPALSIPLNHSILY